jgi:hypothetical protein
LLDAKCAPVRASINKYEAARITGAAPLTRATCIPAGYGSLPAIVGAA